MVIALFFIAAPTIELACLQLDTCDVVAAKLRLYHRGKTITVVPASETRTAEDAVLRVTLRGEGELCACEVLDLSNDKARVARFSCGNERATALHINSELEVDYDRALEALRSQPKRARLAKSQLLAPPASAPASLPSSEETTPAPARVPVRAPESQPASEVAPPPTPYHFGLLVQGGVAGFGATVFGDVGAAFNVQSPVGVGGEVGFRAQLRPADGPLTLRLLIPYLRIHWRFEYERFSVDAALEGDAIVGLAQLQNAFARTFVTGALGPGTRVRFPFIHGRVALFLDARLLAAFHTVELSNGPLPRLLPFVWGAGGGIEIVL